MTRALVVIAGLVLALLPAAPAQAVSWDSWSKYKLGTRARVTTGYDMLVDSKVQFHRKRGKGVRKVSLRWRTTDLNTGATSKWRSTRWKRIKRGKRLTINAPAGTCHPKLLEVQARVKSKHKGPKVVKRHQSMGTC